MTQATQEVSVPDNSVPVSDLNQFVQMLSAWHQKQVATLKHMIEMPEGTEVVLDGKEVILTGDALIAFRAGLFTAMDLLGTLPFIVEMEDTNVG